MIGDDIGLKGFQLLLLFVEQAHHHTNTNVHDVIRYREEPEVTWNHRVDKVNLDVSAHGLTALDVAPVFSVAATIVVSVHHFFIVT